MTEPEKDVKALPLGRSRRYRRDRWLWRGLLLLLVIAIGVRYYYLQSLRWPPFVHDGDAHMVYVQYIAEHWHLPPVDSNFNEYPQQPIYYSLAAFFYDVSKTREKNVENLGRLGFLISVATLYVIFLSLRHLSTWLQRYFLFVFFAFMPAFVLASCCIGNDGLAVFFGALTFLFVLRFNRNPKSTHYFILCLASVLCGILTKLSGVVLIAVVPWLLWRRARYDLSWKPAVQRLIVVGLVFALVASAILYRSWDKQAHRFQFVHSWVWDAMEVKENLIIYTLRFDLAGLIAAGQTTTNDVTENNVRFSFPSWEYGNMMLGEYEYGANSTLLFGSRLMIISGTILLFGFILFVFTTFFSRPIWPLRNIFTLNRVALLLITGSTCLVLSFVYSYPNVCNADYRYQAVTFAWMGYAIGRGLCAFPRSRIWAGFSWAFFLFFFYGCGYFLYCLYLQA